MYILPTQADFKNINWIVLISNKISRIDAGRIKAKMNLQKKTLTEERAARCSRVIDWLIILFYLFYSIIRPVGD